MSNFVDLRFSPNPISNRSAKKSKAGCKACKLRRVKCDEMHPVCSNCRTYFSNRVEACDYSPSPPRSRNAPVGSPLPKTSQSVPLARTDRSPSPQRRIFRTLALLPQTLGLTTLDPFNTQLKSRLPSADQLLHHYLSAVIDKCLPAGHKPEQNPFVLGWWPLVQTDDLLFHMMLLVSAFDLEWQRGKPNTFHSEKYTKECIRLLRDRVQDPVSGASNQTIGAVATLASLEYGRRNMMAVRTHIEGLKKMVAVRGGFERLRSSSPATASVAFWFSLLLTFEPQLPLEDPVETEETPHWLQEISLSSRTLNLLEFKMYGVHEDVSRMLLKIRYLSRYFPTQLDGTSRPILEDLDIHSEVCSLLGRLLQRTKDANPESHAARITTCCRLAASIFLFFPFENHYPDPTLLLHSLLHKLQSALGSIVSWSLDGHRLLAWLLSVGGVAAVNLPTERDWFVSHLAECADVLDFQSWVEMKNCLEKVLWIDAIDDSPFRQLWDEVLVSDTRLTTQVPFCAIRY